MTTCSNNERFDFSVVPALDCSTARPSTIAHRCLIDASRKRHVGDRDRPEPSRCIGVFGLSIYTNDRELREFFSKYGRVQDVQVVYDAQTGRSRGFGFVYYESEDDANEAKEKANGECLFSHYSSVLFGVFPQRCHHV